MESSCKKQRVHPFLLRVFIASPIKKQICGTYIALHFGGGAFMRKRWSFALLSTRQPPESKRFYMGEKCRLHHNRSLRRSS